MRIMLIDDEQRRMEQYVEELQDNGHEVVLQGEVDLALSMLENDSRPFDLIVIDLSMPPGAAFAFEDTVGGSRTGLHLYDRIKGLRPNQKIVALTNMLDARVAERLRREGVRFYRKPETLPFHFAERVEELFAETGEDQ